MTEIIGKRRIHQERAPIEVRSHTNRCDIVICEKDGKGDHQIYVALTRDNAEKLLVALDLFLSKDEPETIEVNAEPLWPYRGTHFDVIA